MPIIDLQKRLHEAGRIRIGQQVPAGAKKRPSKLDTFRFTSRNEAAIRAIAEVYGGQVAPWAEAPTDHQFEVISESSELRVLVPPESMGFSQFYELWKAGGCERRCDGVRQTSDEPCACDAESRECKPVSRLSVMLTTLPSSGLWRLETSGFYAASELSGGFELAQLIAQTSGRSVLGATLRLEQRQVKRPGQGTRNFAVPVLDFDIDSSVLAGEAPGRIGAVTPVPALPAPSLAEQLHAVDNPPERPRRSNGAEPVKPTGLKPRKVQLAEPPKPEPEKEAAPATAPQGASVQVSELAEYFQSLTGPAASKRWLILRQHGWTSEDGNDFAAWAAKQPGDKLAAVFDDLVKLKAPA